MDAWVIQLDSDLNLVDQNSFGGSENDFVYQIVNDNLGHFLILGYSTSNDMYAEGSFGSSDFWAVNFDENLDFLQSYKAGGTMGEALNDAVFTKDGKTLYITGRTESNDVYSHNSFGYTDIWIAKINQDVSLGVNEMRSSDSDCEIYPVPTTGIVNIKNQKDSEFFISDITGKVLVKGKIVSDNQEINIENLDSGMYFIQLSNEIKFSKISKQLILNK